MHAPASINKPIEPRLFILTGDGYGEELLRPYDINEYRRALAVTKARVEAKSTSGKGVYAIPAAVPRIKIFAVGDDENDKRKKSKRKRRGRTRGSRRGKRSAAASPTSSVENGEDGSGAEASPGSPMSMSLGDYTATLSTSATKPMVHVITCNLTERAKGIAVAAGLDRGPEPDIPLTLKPRSTPVLEGNTAMLVRKFVEVPPQDTEAISAVARAEASCDAWRDDRDSNQDRFDVDDPRNRKAIDAERNLVETIRAIRQRQAEAKTEQKTVTKASSRASLRKNRKASSTPSDNGTSSQKADDEAAAITAEMEGKDVFEEEERRVDVGERDAYVEAGADMEQRLFEEQQQLDMNGTIPDDAFMADDVTGAEFQMGSSLSPMASSMSAERLPREYGSLASATAAGELEGIPAEERAMHGVGGFWKDEASQMFSNVDGTHVGGDSPLPTVQLAAMAQARPGNGQKVCSGNVGGSCCGSPRIYCFAVIAVYISGQKK